MPPLLTRLQFVAKYVFILVQYACLFGPQLDNQNINTWTQLTILYVTS